MKIRVIGAAVLLGLLLALIIQYRALRSTQRANASLRQQIDEMELARHETAQAAADASGRLRKSETELLRLRGRVSQLAMELRRKQTTNDQHASDGTPAPRQAASVDELEADLWTAGLTNRVSNGETLVIGGWSRAGDIRGYLLATPLVETADGISAIRQVTVRWQIVSANESFWKEIGWGAFKSDKRRSTVAGVLTPEQLDLLLDTLKHTAGAELSNASQAQRADGEYIGIGFAITDDQETGTVMSVDLFPRISPNGRSVDLELVSAASAGSAPIHSSLTKKP